MKSKAHLLFKHILKNPNKLKYSDLQKFLYLLTNDNLKNMSKGYWCTSISKLKSIGNLAVNKDGFYFLTEQGKLNIDKPFSIKIQNDKTIIDNLKRELKIQKKHNKFMYNQLTRLRDNDLHIRLNLAKVNEAIEYYFFQGFIDELTYDKRFYLKTLLNFSSSFYDYNLKWDNFRNKDLND